MDTLAFAKNILDEGYSCVITDGDIVFKSRSRGIAPVMDIIDNNTNVGGFVLADKIVGKAVALLCIKMGISKVFANVISEGAIEILSKNNIPFSFDTKTSHIINRDGTDDCPMEKTVRDTSDPDTAYQLLSLKLISLKNNSK